MEIERLSAVGNGVTQGDLDVPPAARTTPIVALPPAAPSSQVGSPLSRGLEVPRARQPQPVHISTNPIDLRSAPLVDVLQAIESVLRNRELRQHMGVTRNSAADEAFQAAPRELAGALQYARPANGPEAVVSAGGVEVAGPRVRAQYAARPTVMLGELPPNPDSGQVALGAAKLALLRARLDYRALERALHGDQPYAITSVSFPASRAFPMHVVLDDDGGARLGFGVDVALLRNYASPAIDDESLVQRVRTYFESLTP